MSVCLYMLDPMMGIGFQTHCDPQQEGTQDDEQVLLDLQHKGECALCKRLHWRVPLEVGIKRKKMWVWR